MAVSLTAFGVVTCVVVCGRDDIKQWRKTTPAPCTCACLDKMMAQVDDCFDGAAGCFYFLAETFFGSSGGTNTLSGSSVDASGLTDRFIGT